MIVPHTKRRRAPYMRDLARILEHPSRWPDLAGTSADGRAISIWVAVGADAWQFGKDCRLTHPLLILPPGADPENYNWSACAGHEPILVHRVGDTSVALVHQLARALLRDGVGLVLDTATGELHQRAEANST